VLRGGSPAGAAARGRWGRRRLWLERGGQTRAPPTRSATRSFPSSPALLRKTEQRQSDKNTLPGALDCLPLLSSLCVVTCDAFTRQCLAPTPRQGVAVRALRCCARQKLQQRWRGRRPFAEKILSAGHVYLFGALGKSSQHQISGQGACELFAHTPSYVTQAHSLARKTFLFLNARRPDKPAPTPDRPTRSKLFRVVERRRDAPKHQDVPSTTLRLHTQKTRHAAGGCRVSSSNSARS